ncbi:MAG TPA: YtxH domain-containing protein [Salinimicrobium sp.]|nr:YtxH domain-containing protein [Salinimicrobium sp.]
MTRNVTIGIASGVATAVALGLLFGTEKGKETRQKVMEKYRGETMGTKSKSSKDNVSYPNKTSKAVAE